MTLIVPELILDPVEGDPLYPFASPKDPDTGLYVSGIGGVALLTCKVPDGTIVDLSSTISENAPNEEYTGVILTTPYGGGKYTFRWFWNGPAYYGAIEIIIRVKRSKVLAA